LYFIVSIIDYRACLHLCSYACFGVIGLLVFTIIKGSIGMGAQRWINLFLFKLQPSELTKLFFPFFVTYYFFDQKDTAPPTTRSFIPIMFTLAICLFLIIKQPDLGTALVLLFSQLVIFWCAGLKSRWFLYGFLFILATAPISWHFLKPYQKKR